MRYSLSRHPWLWALFVVSPLASLANKLPEPLRTAFLLLLMVVLVIGAGVVITDHVNCKRVPACKRRDFFHS